MPFLYRENPKARGIDFLEVRQPIMGTLQMENDLKLFQLTRKFRIQDLLKYFNQKTYLDTHSHLPPSQTEQVQCLLGVRGRAFSALLIVSSDHAISLPANENIKPHGNITLIQIVRNDIKTLCCETKVYFMWLNTSRFPLLNCFIRS